MDKEERARVALSLVEGVGPRRIEKIRAAYGAIAPIFTCSSSRKKQLLTSRVAQHISPSLLDEADRVCSWCFSYGITLVFPEDPAYPQLLRNSPDPPFVLYVMGDTAALSRPSVSIVGTRTPSSYGREVAANIARQAVARGYGVVSGLAHGIDGVAHEQALEGGTTVAVLANGLDRIYPAGHRHLAVRIRRQGALVTEYPPGRGGKPYMFLRRNRIISALTMATVVVEAGEKSGALSTAHNALEQNRDVYAVPGSIFSAQSRGTNTLLRHGATPYLDGDSFFSSMDAMYGNPTGQTISDAGTSASVITPVDSLSLENFTGAARKIMTLLKASPQGLRLDQFMEEIDRHEELFSTLLQLEMDEHIIQEGGQVYRLQR
ncbi:DNA-processing protein DprA [Chitinivibrio alkaliphilus]|uniref:DNA protecting protein DprA n=1 Tax=Chitinivibrio alkaliphilus ACht1 TaxID=1313304 RepID=U7D3V7_9BACT|nr:DNA-processing protein DprA [Chitinivibrio alkaliphilus]ERP31189.1 DNA protecting protein DprA [Chitinivibrio alkaliphilus ACht1]